MASLSYFLRKAEPFCSRSMGAVQSARYQDCSWTFKDKNHNDTKRNRFHAVSMRSIIFVTSALRLAKDIYSHFSLLSLILAAVGRNLRWTHHHNSLWLWSNPMAEFFHHISIAYNAHICYANLCEIIQPFNAERRYRGSKGIAVLLNRLHNGHRYSFASTSIIRWFNANCWRGRPRSRDFSRSQYLDRSFICISHIFTLCWNTTLKTARYGRIVFASFNSHAGPIQICDT